MTEQDGGLITLPAEEEQLELFTSRVVPKVYKVAVKLGPKVKAPEGLDMHKRVSGQWSGVVLNAKLDTDKDGDVEATWVIQLDELSFESISQVAGPVSLDARRRIAEEEEEEEEEKVAEVDPTD